MRKAIFLAILVFVVVFLCPKQAHAINPFDFEVHYWQCPEGAESLVECEWIGEYVRTCSNDWYLEGAIGGNHKITHQTNCNTLIELTACKIEFPIYGWVDWECSEVFPFPGNEAYP